MERRFDVRLEELLEDAVLDPRIPKGMLDRLEQFVEPYAARLTSSEQQGHVREYVSGLCSDVKRKNSEMIAYLHDQERHAAEVHRPVAVGRSSADRRTGATSRCGVGRARWRVVFDPSGFKEQEEKLGRGGATMVRASGKNRQLPGGYILGVCFSKGACPGGHAAVLEQEEWAKDKKRRKKCGVPAAIRFRTRHAAGPGDACGARESLASRLDCRRRRNGA